MAATLVAGRTSSRKWLGPRRHTRLESWRWAGGVPTYPYTVLNTGGLVEPEPPGALWM